MNKSSISYGDAKKLDKFLFDLAVYECTGGKIFAPESMDEMIEFQKRAAETFNRFKFGIRSGEFTIDDLESHIVARNSAVKMDDENPYDDIDEAIKQWEKDELLQQKASVDLVQGFIEYMQRVAQENAVQANNTMEQRNGRQRDDKEKDD